MLDVQVLSFSEQISANHSSLAAVKSKASSLHPIYYNYVVCRLNSHKNVLIENIYTELLDVGGLGISVQKFF